MIPTVILLGLLLAGCATPASLTMSGAPTDPEAALRARLIGNWQGDVDLTFPERTLVVHRVRHQEGRWMADVEYGTTGVFLTSLGAVVDTASGQASLVFVTPLASTVRLALDADDVLRGTFRLPTETQDRPIELKRVSATPATPSTAAERLARAATRAAPGAAPGSPAGAGAPVAVAAAPPAPPVRPSLERDLEVSLPRLLVGRWEGELDFTVSARLLVIDALRREGGTWVVRARYGVSDANLTPVDLTVDTSEDRVTLRFNTALASRATLTLHADAALRGTFRLAFEARDRRLDFKRVATATAGGPEALAVAFRHPPDQTRLGESSLVVTAVVSSGRGVAGVEVGLNGAEVHRQADPARPKSVVVSVPLTLREGANVVSITAREADGTIRQDVRTVFYERPSQTLAVVPTPAAPPPARERWAVVIGVGRYDHKGIPRLGYAAADAEAVYGTLTGPGGFKKENVLLLTDRSERKPTLRNIRYSLGTFLARSAGKDDTVVIFFAGHGAPEVDLRGAERDGLAKYLIPSDADPDDLYATA
ncbi:MAG: caspase family protein, partial [Candidatus Rokubacteria bacterium]|nr:caspase family protein [Candidatus Rokubacteria bacterium]